MKKPKKIQRRDFLKTNLAGMAGLSVGIGSSALAASCNSSKSPEEIISLRQIREKEYSTEEMIFVSSKLRKSISLDRYRPKYHIRHPEGFHNDVNGLQFWKGRYHLFYLGRTPVPDVKNNPDIDAWNGRVWHHVSSSDLIHWVHHPIALEAPTDGSTNLGPQSGDAIDNAPIPTLIYHWAGHGTFISTSEDDYLINWKPLPANPVIAIAGEEAEYVVFDPCAWYDKDLKTYYALIGNKNRRKGFEGDCTSLFRSKDLVKWEYIGPFYKSSREWTFEEEDAACPDFFPLNNKYMLLMHCHGSYGNCHYYIGDYKDEKFYPEKHGRMSWPGGQLAGPETLLDDKGRRIFFAWIPEAQGRDWKKDGWASTISLPRILSLFDNGELKIEPAEELKSLRKDHFHKVGFNIEPETEFELEDFKGNSIEILTEISINDNTEEVGIKVLCSPDGQEETSIVFVPSQETLKIDFVKSSMDKNIRYTVRRGDATIDFTEQVAPFKLSDRENLRLRIFVDYSVIEVFANDKQCLTQRIYPTNPDSTGIKMYIKGKAAKVISFDAWHMEPVSS